ncbi:PD-(D/E)XK nuclease family protein [Burkholderia gladioli]|uniref:PDDEXK-like family protein n=1 Tax=Burkholderia gladioli TaxID=28095 RepID=UPI001FC895D9|nr:PD-(D/E)XK nuclease family protein [Burkholderia gladioli]
MDKHTSIDHTGNLMADYSPETLIDYFFADANVQRLVTSTASWQPLRICYPKEVNVSRFLAWLLDPSEGHGLGDWAIQSLLIRAWWNSDDADVPLTTRRFLSPSNVQTEGFSSAVVTTEVDLNGRSLDVLIVDASHRRYIAIENKFGAQQSRAQLKDYREQLEKLLPDFLGVHIFLDSREAVPEDAAWIPVGYDWLAEFLREAEKREATAQHVQQALSQFRNVIEDEAEDSMGKSAFGHLVTEVARGHPEVLELMTPWARHGSKGARVHMLTELISEANTLDGKSMLRLFQLYWRRASVWDHCIRQAQFAPFVSALRQRFDDVLVDPKRVRTGFSLMRWDSLIDLEQFSDWNYYPAGVNVRQTGEKFQVTTFIQLNHVRAEKRDVLIEAAEAFRKTNGVRRKMSDEQSFVVLRRLRDLNKSRAVNETLSQLVELQARLESIR